MIITYLFMVISTNNTRFVGIASEVKTRENLGHSSRQTSI